MISSWFPPKRHWVAYKTGMAGHARIRSTTVQAWVRAISGGPGTNHIRSTVSGSTLTPRGLRRIATVGGSRGGTPLSRCHPNSGYRHSTSHDRQGSERQRCRIPMRTTGTEQAPRIA